METLSIAGARGTGARTDGATGDPVRGPRRDSRGRTPGAVWRPFGAAHSQWPHPATRFTLTEALNVATVVAIINEEDEHG